MLYIIIIIKFLLYENLLDETPLQPHFVQALIITCTTALILILFYWKIY